MEANDIKQYLQQQLKLIGIETAESDPYITVAMEAGGNLFGTYSWAFLCKEKNITLTSGTAAYNLAHANYVSTDIDSVISIQRLSSVDEADVDILAVELFDAKYPNPSAMSNGYPDECKVQWLGDELTVTFASPPNSAYTMRIYHKIKWNDNLIGGMPSRLSPVLLQACSVFTAPTNYGQRATEHRLFLKMADQAEIRDRAEISQRISKVTIHGGVRKSEGLNAIGHYDMFGI